MSKECQEPSVKFQMKKMGTRTALSIEKIKKRQGSIAAIGRAIEQKRDRMKRAKKSVKIDKIRNKTTS
jgi:hypothetical protein